MFLQIDKPNAAFLVSLTTDVNIPDNVVVPFDLVHYYKVFLLPLR